jgi:serine protease
MLNKLATLAIAAGLALGAASTPASGLMVDAIVVKYRNDEGLVAVPWLPSQLRSIVADAFGNGITEIGRTRDGAFRLAIDPPLEFPAAEAALNGLRLREQVLYAETTSRVPVAPSARRQDRSPPATDDPPLSQIIVKYRDPAIGFSAARQQPPAQFRLDRIASTLGTMVAHERGMHDGAYVLRLFAPMDRATLERLTDDLERDAEIEWAQPDYINQISIAPNDSLYVQQWHYYDPIGGANLPNAWNRTTGNATIRVAVLDTGSLPAHPDLAGRFIGGFDFITNAATGNDGNGRDADPSDPGDWNAAGECGPGSLPGSSSWHGTHVAGTIGAATNNGIGVAGINWNSAIVPVRVLGRCGGSTSDVADGIVWASGGAVSGVPPNANPARVLNLSLGAERTNRQCDAAFQSAINAALSRNAVVVVAAGNKNKDASFHSPANCAGVITVAATGFNGERASYSNHDSNDGSGIQVEIAAPGDSVLSTHNRGTTTPDPSGYDYAAMWGTSMATPHVAGIVSLMLSVNPSLTPAQILSKIQTTARPFPTGTISDCTSSLGAVTATVKYCGAGIINADAAVAAAQTTSTTTLASSSNPAVVGESVTFTATVAGAAPTGNVAFSVGGNFISGCGSVPLAGAGNARVAQCTTSSLLAGAHSIGASYAGDVSNTPSVAASLTQMVVASLPSLRQRDFNADGRGDVLWRSNTGSGHAIWLMNGGSPIALANLAAPAAWHVTHTADFDGDGRHDLIFRNQSTGVTAMWLMHGTTPVAFSTLLSNSSWTVTHTGDFNGDGRSDLVWFNASTNTTSLWLMNGTSMAGGATMLTAPNWRVTHVADVNGDGRDDLVWRNSATGQTAIWLLNGTAFLQGSVVLTSTAWSVILTGYFNGDGKADLVWRNASNGQVAVWLMNGLAMSYGATVLWDANWSPTHVADFDGNGRSDLVWRNASTGATAVWLMNGTNMASGASVTIPGSTVVAAGDFNGDRRADLLWHNPTSGLTQIRLMLGASMGPSLPLLTGAAWTPRP